MPCFVYRSLRNQTPSGIEKTGVLLIKMAVNPIPDKCNARIDVRSPRPYREPPRKSLDAYDLSIGNGRILELKIHIKIKRQLGIKLDIAAPVIGSVSVNPSFQKISPSDHRNPVNDANMKADPFIELANIVFSANE